MPSIVTPQQRQAAKREIVRQVTEGISAREARSQSAVSMHRVTVYRLLKRVQNQGEMGLCDGRHGHPVKLRGEVLAFLMGACQADPAITSPQIQRGLQEHFGQAPSVSQLNRVRARLGLSRKKGPREKKASRSAVD